VKCDLHRHLGGAIKPGVVYQILKEQRRGSYFSKEEVAHDLQYQPGEKRDFQTFLKKFDVLDVIVWNEKAIEKAIEQVCFEIAKEKIEYVEIKLSIDKYVKHTNWTEKEVINFAHSCFGRYADKWDILVGLVLSLKYESNRDRQKHVSKIIADPSVVDLLHGIDLVGDEQYFDASFYAPIFKEWKQAGKGLQAHVGESQGAENVRAAIEQLGVQRIAHGIKAAEFPDILKLANDNNICFDIALTSNYFTGVIDDLATHPVKKMLEQGCNITIGTDDPVVLDTTLDKEYSILMNTVGVPESKILDIMENSVKYAFVKPR
jgi:adenosine deaminase